MLRIWIQRPQKTHLRLYEPPGVFLYAGKARLLDEPARRNRTFADVLEMGNHEIRGCARHSHVEETTLLLELHRVAARALMRDQPLVATDEDHGMPLPSLGAEVRAQRDAVLLILARVGLLRLRHGVFDRLEETRDIPVEVRGNLVDLSERDLLLRDLGQ